MTRQRKSSILIVDDDPEIARLHASLVEELGYLAIIETDPLQALQVLDRDPQIEVVLLDIRMPGLSGSELLGRIKASHPRVGVVMATVINDIGEAVASIKAGAYNYLLKPLATESLGKVLRSYFENRPQAAVGDPRFSPFITGSSLFEPIFRRVESYAQAEVPVLIQGETGTGKELIAQLIHSLSPRRCEPFLAINMAALSPQLFESSLFGHRKGSFTGAIRDEAGYFRAVGKGTLFLDEIGELGEEQQKKLLRVLQDFQFTPVGGTTPRKLEARVLAATNRDLQADSLRGRFRQDLFYRLAGHSIAIPPLRERVGDIERLSAYFVRKYCTQFNRNLDGIHPETLAALKAYRFPGNVREIEGAISGAVLIESQSQIMPSSLPKHIQDAAENPSKAKAPIRMDSILQALEQCDGNQTQAARQLGIARGTLNRLLNKERETQRRN